MDYSFLILGLFSIIAWHTLQQGRIHLNRLKITRERKCQPPTAIPQRDPIFGLDIVLKIFKSFEERKRNLSLTELVKTYGPTHQSKPYGTTRVFSIEPQNLQAVFATDFGSFGVEPLRLFIFKPFIGRES
jgi:hypothetical protein